MWKLVGYRFTWRKPGDELSKPVYRWIALAACLALTACGTLHKTAPGWAAPIRPPAELTEPVAEPQLPAEPTNGDLAEWADRLLDALRTANERLRAIRGL